MPNPARPDRPGRPPHHAPGADRDRTEEAATTHPTPTNPTQPDRAGPAGRLLRRLARRPPTVVRRLGIAALIILGLLVAVAPPAFAAGGSPTLSGVISNLTNWIVGILAGVATLFLTIGGLRYLTAGGDPGQVEKAKIALKSACHRLRAGHPGPAAGLHPRLAGRRLMSRPFTRLRLWRLSQWRPRHPRLLLAVGGLVVVLALGRR